MLDYFVNYGVYKLRQYEDIFLCEYSSVKYLGKLVLYIKIGKNMYKRSDTQYFLSVYFLNDIKELFVNRDNYDMLGRVGNNYVLSEDKIFLVAKEN